MMKIGTETGSLINHVMSASTSGIPEVGMGATILSWSDRTAGTIIAASDREFVVQVDTAKRTDNRGMSDCQSYEYSPNPDGITYAFKRVARGHAKGEWRMNGRKDGRSVIIGYRNQYFDFSF
jgi:hypothetical protein